MLLNVLKGLPLNNIFCFGSSYDYTTIHDKKLVVVGKDPFCSMFDLVICLLLSIYLLSLKKQHVLEIAAV